MRRYIIIGCGAAGMAAAETIRRLEPASDLRLVTADPYGYYSRPGLAYYLNGDVPREQLFPFPEAHWRELGVHRLNARVESIDPDGHILCLADGRKLPYDRLLIATGAEANLPDTPGMNLQGVVRLDSLDDADHILKLARRGQTAFVTGGGITALELVEGLSARGMKVHYLLRGERYWSAVLDETESRIVEERLKREGVLIHYNTRLVEVLGKRGQVAGVRIKNNDTQRDLPCSIVAVAIGIRPRTSLARSAGIEVGKGIRTNAALQTSRADIFAAGDVAEVQDPLSGEYVVDSLWGPALEMGSVAGAGMTGRAALYRQSSPFNVTRLAGLVTTLIGQIAPNQDIPTLDLDVDGIMRGDSQVWRMHPDAVVAETQSGDNRLRIYLRGSRMAGALLMGNQELSRTLQNLIRCETDLGDLRPALLEPGARLHQILRQYA
jgi:NAD(P)H-nitrite reductase large subunit